LNREIYSILYNVGCVYKGVTMSEKRENRNSNSWSFGKLCAVIGNGSEILFSIGAGSLLAFYLIELCKVKLVPLSDEIEKLILTGNTQAIYMGLLEYVIFMVGVIAILIAPLLSQRNKGVGIKVFLLLVLALIDIGGVITVIAQGRVFSTFILVVWISSVYMTWFCIGVMKIIYGWIKIDKEEKNQFDVAKLTFIWAIIAFLLGWIMK